MNAQVTPRVSYLDMLKASESPRPDPEQNDDCDHRSVDIRAFTCRNGTVQYVKQCLRCGDKVGSPIRKDAAAAARGDPAMIPPFDERARDEWRQQRQQRQMDEIDAQRAEAKRQRDAESQAWRAWYDAYLQSPAWQRTRAKVFQRARGRCEGCLEAAAEVVHHLTYRHAGNELLYELVALCRDCHDRAHDRAVVEPEA